jgi:hypothetical protein
MCDVITMTTTAGWVWGSATAGTVAAWSITAMDIIAVVGAGMAAASAMKGSAAARDMSQYNAAVQRNNRIIAERNEKRILKQGKYEANAYRARTRSLISDQMVLMAAQGGDISFGSNVDLLADTAELGERDAITIEANAADRAYDEQLKGLTAGSQADLYATQAANEDPLYAGVSTLFSTGGTVAHRWAMKQNTRV